MKFLKLQDIMRAGMAVLVAVYVFAVVTEGATVNLDYPIVREYNIPTKPRSKPREIRGFKPQSMSTAIGFGKRQSDSYGTSETTGQEAMSFPITDYRERVPMEWFVHFFNMNLNLLRKIEKNLLMAQQVDRTSVTRRYKKNKNDFSFYYNE